MSGAGGGRTLARKVWDFLDGEPETDKLAAFFGNFSMFVIVVSVLGFLLQSESYCYWHQDELTQVVTRRCPPPEEVKEYTVTKVLEFTEMLCIFFFTVEYLLKLCTAHSSDKPHIKHSTWRFIVHPPCLIDIAAIVPWYLENIILKGQASGARTMSVLRILRMSRLARVVRGASNMRSMNMLASTFAEAGSAIGMLIMIVLLLMVLFGSMINAFEPHKYYEYDTSAVNPENGIEYKGDMLNMVGTPHYYTSITESMWWTIVTLTSEGYGDHYPVTPGGMTIGIITVLMGLICLSLPITIIGQNFVEQVNKEERLKEKTKRHLEEAGLVAGLTNQKPQREQDVDRIAKALMTAHMQYHRNVRAKLREKRIRILTTVNPHYKDPDELLVQESGLKDKVGVSSLSEVGQKMQSNLRQAMKSIQSPRGGDGHSPRSEGGDLPVEELSPTGDSPSHVLLDDDLDVPPARPESRQAWGASDGNDDDIPRRPSSRQQAWGQASRPQEVNLDAPATRPQNQLTPLSSQVNDSETKGAL